jgi:hypothetical protein
LKQDDDPEQEISDNEREDPGAGTPVDTPTVCEMPGGSSLKLDPHI